MAQPSQMDALRQLYGQPRDKYQGDRPRAVAEVREPARLLNHRRAPGAILAAIDDNGVARLLRLTSADHPELARLGDTDRATLQAAVIALHRDRGPEVGDVA